MDVFPKFIIEGENLIIAKCTYHKELAEDVSLVRGGGWWSKKDDSFTLFGKSEDFGTASLEDIQECILKGNVFTNSFLTHSIADKYSFYYRDQCGEIYTLKEKTL